MTQGGGFFLELDGTQFKKELKQLQKLYFQTLKEMEAQGFTGRRAQQAAREAIVQKARRPEGVGLGTSEAGGLGGYGKKRSSGLWVKGTGKTGMPSTGLSLEGMRGAGSAEQTSQITRENISKILSQRVMDHAEHDDSISEHSEQIRKQNEKREMANARARAVYDVKNRNLRLKEIQNAQKAYWGERIKMATRADLSLAKQRARTRQEEQRAEEVHQKTRAKAQDQFHKDNSKANKIVYQQEQKATQVRERAVNKIRNQIQASQDMIRSERELGQASGVSASGIQRQILALEKLRGATALATGDKTRYVQGINAEIAALQKLQAQQLNSTSQMVFMAGASAGVQKGIRNIGAAAQGGMLAMSAMNGDVMGLAFSLIFLQFAANLPVALGFGAIALGGALAFKSIKKILDERKEIEKIGTSFFLITGSVQAGSLAFQKAEAITKNLGLASKNQDELNKALATSMSEMRRRGIEPTADALKVVTAAWASLIANTDKTEEDYEKALTGAAQAGVNFAENSIASIDGVPMSLEEAQKRGDFALSRLVTNIGLANTEFGILKDRAEESGVAIPKVLEGLGDNETLKDWENTDTGKALLKLAQDILLAESQSGTSATLIDTAFKEIGYSAGEQIGAGGVVDLAAQEFNKSMGGMSESAADAAEKAQDAITKYTSLAQILGVPVGQLEAAQFKASKLLANLDSDMMSGGGSLLYGGTDSSPHTAGSQVNLAADDTYHGTSTVINVNVTGNTVSSDEGLANEIEMAITRGVNWSTIPTPGIK